MPESACCSIAIVGVSPVMFSTSGFSIISKNCPGVPKAIRRRSGLRRRWCRRPGLGLARTGEAGDDHQLSRGIFTSIFFRLCSRARRNPVMKSLPPRQSGARGRWVSVGESTCRLSPRTASQPSFRGAAKPASIIPPEPPKLKMRRMKPGGTPFRERGSLPRPLWPPPSGRGALPGSAGSLPARIARLPCGAGRPSGSAGQPAPPVSPASMRRAPFRERGQPARPPGLHAGRGALPGARAALPPHIARLLAGRGAGRSDTEPGCRGRT